MARSTIELENAAQIADAFKNINMGRVVKTLMDDLQLLAEKQTEYRPPQMGYSGNSSKPTSSGNSIRNGKTFWKRGDGAYYVYAEKETKVRRFRVTDEDTGKKSFDYSIKQVNRLKPVGKLRSDNLQESFESRVLGKNAVANSAYVVEVGSTGVRYANFVMGGAADDPGQSQNMKKRGWRSVDEIAQKLDGSAARLANRIIVQQMVEYLRSKGVTATAS